MAVIFLGSTDLLSNERTSRFLGPFLRWLKPDISEEVTRRIQIVVRKCGHLTEYAILAVLFWRAIRRPQQGGARSWSWRWAAWVLLWTTLYAVTDEFHQSLVATRFASAWDVATDAFGGVIGLLLVNLKCPSASRT